MTTSTPSTQIIPSGTAVGRAMESASGAVHRATDSVSNAAHSAYESATSGARHAVESVSDAATHVAAIMESGGEHLKHAGKRLGSNLQTQLHKRPFTTVAIAIGAGYLLSWLLRPR
ncbi:MAG: hypothetical protein ACT4NL_08745 [Pseudomarimonas sp.]